MDELTLRQRALIGIEHVKIGQALSRIFMIKHGPGIPEDVEYGAFEVMNMCDAKLKEWEKTADSSHDLEAIQKVIDDTGYILASANHREWLTALHDIAPDLFENR